MLGRSLAHSNASPSIFVPSHMPGLSFPPPPPHPVLLSAGQPAACPFEEAAIRASAVFLPASAAMPCYGCAVPVTQTQPMAKLERVRQRRPGQGALGKQGRSLEAPEPSSPRKNRGETLHIPERVSGAERADSPRRAKQSEWTHGASFHSNHEKLLSSPRAAQGTLTQTASRSSL